MNNFFHLNVFAFYLFNSADTQKIVFAPTIYLYTVFIIYCCLVYYVWTTSEHAKNNNYKHTHTQNKKKILNK